jgi:hypothetical protein
LRLLVDVAELPALEEPATTSGNTQSGKPGIQFGLNVFKKN